MLLDKSLFFLKICGGIIFPRKAAESAKSKGIKFCPMVGINSAVSLAASLHVSASSDCIAVEFDPFDNPLLKELSPGFPEIKQGLLRVPNNGGLGLGIDKKFIQRNRIKL